VQLTKQQKDLLNKTVDGTWTQTPHGINIKGNFYCQCNQLTTLQGAPTTIEGNFSCQCNKFTTLQGMPKQVNGQFNCGPEHHQEPQYKLWQLKQKLCNS
jgi:hypothetical protein